MNRSVINVLIAAGVLSAGAGVCAAPAVADRTGAVGGSDTSDTKDGINDDNNPGGTEHPRPPRWDRGEGPGTADGSTVLVPCQTTWTCPWQWRGRRNFNAFIPPATPGVQQPLPVPPVVSAAEPGLDVGALVAAEAPSAPESGPVAAQPVVVPAVVPRAVAAQAAPPPVRLPGTVPTPPVSRPQSPPATDTTESLRLGYPEELRTADLRHVASVALPGLAALAGMTALGGLFGYRQAKAGYVLRTAGAGRFLQ